MKKTFTQALLLRGRSLFMLPPFTRKLLLMAKFTLLLLPAFLQVSAKGYSQNKISVDFSNMGMEKVFHYLERKTGYVFYYNNDELESLPNVDMRLNGVTVSQLLDSLSKQLNIHYNILDNKLVVISRESSNLQAKKISGKVVNAKGDPLPGVTVQIKGTTQGATTDVNGAFALEVPDNAVLVLSGIGYLKQEVAVGNQATLSITMKEDVAGLNEVVVVGYGEQKKETLTGSVASVTSREINTTTNENVENMLTGKLPGVRIVQNSSEPGSFNNKFDIRGFGSPLIVIDGVPRGNINRLDPNDIESISVLKDASAAVYGVRAANGVILITTKKGQAGTLELTYTGTVGVQTPSGLPRNLDAVQWMTLVNEHQMHNVNGGSLAYSEDEIEQYKNGTKKTTDWFAPVIDPRALQTEHNLSARGGTDKINYYVGLGYLKQDGFWKSGDLNYERYNVRSNISSKITKRLTAQLNLSAIMDEKNQPYADAWTIFKSLWRQVPVQTVYANNNPKYLGNTLDGSNPVAMSTSDISGYKKFDNKWIQSSFSLTYDLPFMEGLQAKGLYSYDYSMSDNKQYQKAFNLYDYDAATDTYKPTVSQSPSNLNRSFSESPSSLLQLSLNYNHLFNKVHNVSALLLYEESTQSSDNFYAQRELALEVDQLIAGSSLNQIGYMDANGLWKQTNKGLVGKFNYDYKSKYLAEFSFRYDGSSKFAPGKQWGFFPDVSVGWRISEEGFMKNNSSLSFIDNLKLRASYGKMGDDGASSYQFITGYTYPAGGSNQGLAGGYIFDGNFVNAVGFTNLPNPNITWFTVNTLNVGLDLDMWNGLLGVTAEVFKRHRDGLLATELLSLPSSLGANLPQENLNSDQTSGLELAVSHKNTIGDLLFSVTGNFAYTRTKWLNYVEATAGNSYDNWRNHLDDRFNDIWWGNGYIGQYQSFQDIWNSPVYVNRGTLPGDYAYEDWNGDGVIDGWDAHPIATNGIPQITYGLTLAAQYKGFDLNALFQGAALVYVSYPEQLAQPLNWNGGGLNQFMDRWHPEDPTADPYDPNTKWVPGYYAYTGTVADQNSAAGVQNASYLRLKSLEIGYSLPKDLTAKAGIKNVRIYANAYNLLTFTGIRYVDPEHPSDTYGYIYPLNKSYNVGLNVTF